MRGVIDLAGVITRAGTPGDRGRPSPRPVADVARELGVAVHTDLDDARRLAPDLLVWAAFGQKLPSDLLAVRYGGLNVHASLLPRWRGPAPIQAAILAGDEHTGVTLMRGDTGIDTGPLLASRATPISPYDDAVSLETRLGEMGADLLEATLPRFLAGVILAVPQDDAKATRSHRLSTAESALDFTRPARENWRLVRAAVPRPVARTFWKGRPLLVWHARVSDKAEPSSPGRVRVIGDEVCIDTPERLFVPQVVQPAGRRKMSAPEWARGARLGAGSRFPS
ncbi:MAG TPA: methionyl-tRNA formyltransferase [Candidatus Limnocylindria bacterium]|nr:methionyl-tRNA formyltransferase [Candidatus Limnocylindria bacterium]